MAEVPFRPVRQLSEYKGKGASVSREKSILWFKRILKTDGRPANSHGFTVRLTVWGINSRSHDLASKSHGESENLEIAKQFR